MYIETRFYDNGYAEARMTKDQMLQGPNDNTGKYDYYVDEVDGLQEWIEDNLSIETNDIVELVINLKNGEWVDITHLC